jgi:alpha-L-fucosidase
MHNYGSIDILWLDGGWVRPLETVDEEVRGWGARIPDWDQGINIPAIAEMARKAQPGLIIVDRTVHGPYENYQTPEQRIPETQLSYPWESCMTLANNWGYVLGDHFKSSATVIHALIEIVAKGGSLLLGVGPKPDGLLSEETVQHLKEIGMWLDKNGTAIYNTRTTKNYHDGNVWFTQNPKLGYSYALVCLNDSSDLPVYVEWAQNPPAKGTVVKLLETGKAVSWTREGELIKIMLPPDLLKEKRKFPALAFSFIAEKKEN